MAETVEEIEDITDAAAANPKQVSADGVTVTGQNIPDLLSWERQRAEREAARSPGLGIRLFRTRPPGAT